MELLVELVQKSQFKTAFRFWLYLLRHYFRIEVEGLENLPRNGRALIVPNHSSFSGIDAVMLAFVIKRETRRRARILAHRAFFDVSKKLRTISQSFGLQKASVTGGIEMLKRDRLVILFPEGESGNFKSTLRRYELQKFHTGYLRMAIPAQAPIVPCIIIGAEETHFNLGNINLSKIIPGAKIPLPISLFPMPAKWRIVFLPPIPPEHFDAGLLESQQKIRKETAAFQRKMQRELNKRVKKRTYVYTKKSGHLAARARKFAFQVKDRVLNTLVRTN